MKTAMEWLFPVLPARRLAALRVLVGGFAAVYVLVRLPHLLGYAHFDAHLFAPVGVVSLTRAPLPPVAVIAVTIATAVAGIAFVLGARFRISGPGFAVLLLWTLTYRNSWHMVFHTENLMVLQVLAIGLSPAADEWSFDARRRSSPEASGSYGWPLRLCTLLVVLTYVLAGIAKLRWCGTG